MSHRLSRVILAFILLIQGVILCLPRQQALADTKIYYYRDERGVYHFTNRPSSPRYSLFAVFRNALTHADSEEIRLLVDKYSLLYGMERELIEAVIQVESNYESEAVSPAGAEGLMQIMPNTQKELGIDQPFDPETNIEAGVRYLRGQLDRFGSVELALAAYNAGPAQVEKYAGIPPFKETRWYVNEVLDRYEKLKNR